MSISSSSPSDRWGLRPPIQARPTTGAPRPLNLMLAFYCPVIALIPLLGTLADPEQAILVPNGMALFV